MVAMSDTILPMAACQGCGVVLPGSGDPWDPRSTASEACHALYGEVLGYEHEHLAELGGWHQLLVDTYGAQHVGPRSPAITGAFGLIGLYLTLERGWTGLRVRAAHQALAARYRDWPLLGRPPEAASMTVQDLAFAGTPAEYVEVLHDWAGTVWASWRREHPRIAELVRERLPGEDRVVGAT